MNLQEKKIIVSGIVIASLSSAAFSMSQGDFGSSDDNYQSPELIYEDSLASREDIIGVVKSENTEDVYEDENEVENLSQLKDDDILSFNSNSNITSTQTVNNQNKLQQSQTTTKKPQKNEQQSQSKDEIQKEDNNQIQPPVETPEENNNQQNQPVETPEENNNQLQSQK